VPRPEVAGAVAGDLQVSEAAEEAGAVEGEAALELTLMAVSSAIALAGIGIAAFIWLKRREIAAAMAKKYPGVHRVLLNKYYVDEAYDAAVVQPILVGSQEGLWRGFDVRVIDGAVNGTGAVVVGGSAVLRHLQTGSRLRQFDVHRRGRHSRLLPVAINAVSTPNSQRPAPKGGSSSAWALGFWALGLGSWELKCC
jgi:NADH:ubiquinone oxidoreductase subunit 5 (subunit L)/multisubunit Na+/H+ antiporter MnhA subunit